MLDPNDVMWAEFQLLWHEFRNVGIDLLVCGGFGLFLKQNWLLQNHDIVTIVNMADWLVSAPRATRDFDVIVGLDIIADTNAHKQVRAILDDNGYAPTKINPYWQFEKTWPDNNRTITLDLHAQRPEDTGLGLKYDKYRVKRIASLGNQGFHARTNPEAVGCQINPLPIEFNDLRILVPNSLTWCIMKLTAMRDQWEKSLNPQLDAATRDRLVEQFSKHAQDVCRIVAMTTRGEYETVDEIKIAIRETKPFATGKQILGTYFSEDGMATHTVEDMWGPDDFEQIQKAVLSWFDL